MNLERRKFLKNLAFIALGLCLSRFLNFDFSKEKEIKIGDFLAKEEDGKVIFLKDGKKVFSLNEKGEIEVG